MTPRTAALAGALIAFTATPALAQDQAWVERSNAFTGQVLAMQAQFEPEGASQNGLEQYDGKAMDLGPAIDERFIAAEEAKLGELRTALAAESDPNVQQDLQILIDSLGRDIEGVRLDQRLTIDWYDVPRIVFGNMNALLDDQVAPARRAKALVRLRRYVGLEPNTTPFAVLARDRLREAMVPGRQLPFKGQIEKNLSNSTRFVDGAAQLFQKYKIAGAEEGLQCGWDHHLAVRGRHAEEGQGAARGRRGGDQGEAGAGDGLLLRHHRRSALEQPPEALHGACGDQPGIHGQDRRDKLPVVVL